MMKFYTLFVVALIGFVGNAQIVNIPDANFKAKLLSTTAGNYIAIDLSGQSLKIDENNDGQIQLSEVLQVKNLDVSSSSISNLTGIESFTNMQYFYCSSNQITGNLSLSALVNLKTLSCSNNQITSISLSNMPQLNSLNCSFNNLTTLTLASFPALNEVNSMYNPSLSTFNFSNLPAITILNFSNCNLSSVNLNNLTSLLNLTLNYNHLSSLDVSALINLTNLSCAGNQLSGIDVQNLIALRTFNCGGNQITELNVSNLVNLITLVFSYNQVQTLDVSNLHHLSTLICRSNNISSFFLKNGYNYTLADNDQMNYYTLSGNPIAYICGDDNKIASLMSYYSSSDSIVINSYCSFVPGGEFYTLQGNARYDYDNTGCDSSDQTLPSVNFLVTNSNNVVGNFNYDLAGNYSIPLQAGSYTVAPILENPSYFTVSPTSANVTFPTAANPFLQNFCVSANGVHNDLEVTLLPIGPARPGFDAVYKIIYKNKGTQSQSGTVSLSFYDPIEDFVSANPNFTSQSTNMLNWPFSNLLPFETREITVTFNLNSPTETPALNAGNGIIYTATITGTTDESPNDNIIALNQTVVNSYDPNDKTCTEGNNLPVYEVGKYLHYIIRFENTGSANAENIIVKDVIDTTKLDVTSLIPLNGSHPFETKISNTNQVEFIFENINLPFDNANNDGYVAFKIKTLPTLTAGQVITNSASIYFDYNAPIVTDPNVVTVFNPLGVPQVDFGTVFSLSPVPAKNNLTLTTKQAVSISSISIYNTLGQLVQVNTNPNEIINVSGLKTGTYFIKIISDKGTAGSQFIKQ